MTGFRRYPLRVIGRFLLFVAVVVGAFADYFFTFGVGRKKAASTARAVWLQRHSRRTLKILKLVPRVHGPVPSAGLLISNHLGYLDILVYSSIAPMVFVSKRDVKFWPVVGALAQLGGTVFVDRRRRTQVGEVNDEVEAALDSGALVVLFPEGTSSNGGQVLPFRTALLEPVVSRGQPVSIACIQYAVEDSDVGQEVCYWGNHTFFPHFLNLLSKEKLRVAIQFTTFAPGTASRKELAGQLRQEVEKLKPGCAEMLGALRPMTGGSSVCQSRPE